MLLGEYNTTVLPTYHQHAGIEGTNKNYRLKERQMATSFLNGWLQRALMNLPLLHTTVCVCVRVVLLPYIVLYRIPFQNIRGLFEKKKNCTNNGTAAGRTSLVSPKRMNARNFFLKFRAVTIKNLVFLILITCLYLLFFIHFDCYC